MPTFAFRLPAAAHELLKDEASRRGMTVSRLVRLAIARLIEDGWKNSPKEALGGH
jgi:predicted DNA-binding protein